MAQAYGSSDTPDVDAQAYAGLGLLARPCLVSRFLVTSNLVAHMYEPLNIDKKDN
jgi:hypothetical protein